MGEGGFSACECNNFAVTNIIACIVSFTFKDDVGILCARHIMNGSEKHLLWQ